METKLGSGVQGTVFLTALQTVKKVCVEKQTEIAIAAAVVAGEAGIGPRVYDHSTHTMEMEYIQGKTLEETLWEVDIKRAGKLAWAAGQLVARLNKLGYQHGDIHGGNFIVDLTGRLYLIDYGFAFVEGNPERTSVEDSDSGEYSLLKMACGALHPQIVKGMYAAGHAYELAH